MKKALVLLLGVCVFHFGPQAQLIDKSKTKGLLNKVKNNSTTGNTNSGTQITSPVDNDEFDTSPDSAQIIFSDEPFKAGQVTGKKEFKAGQRIYGRLILKKALKKYEDKDNGDPIRCINFEINHLDYHYDGTNVAYKSCSDQELNSSVIDFDVLCNKGQRNDVTFTSNSFSKYIYYKEHANKKVSFRIRLKTRESQCANSTHYARFKKPIESDSDFSIDFTGVDEEGLKKLYYLDKTPECDTDAGYGDKIERVTTDYMKKIQLPAVFSTTDGKGYRDPKCTKEILQELIKKTFNTNEVVYFRFIESGSTADWGQRMSSRGGHEKVGEQKFLFAYKDKDDGVCRFACATIVRYMGYSSTAGDPEILTLKVFERDDTTNYPHDLNARDIGIDYLYFVDGDKLKK